METQRTNTLTQKRGAFSVSVIPFTLLCSYLACVNLVYVSWFPNSLNSLLLYGFIAASVGYLLLAGRIRIGSHTIWYAVFCALCLMSCLYSADSAISLTMTGNVAKIVVFSAMFINIVNSIERLRIAMFAVTASTEVLFIHLLLTNQLEVEERLGESLTGNANIFATLFMVGVFCAIFFMYFSERKLSRIVAFAAFLTQMYALALSGGRKYFLLPLILVCILKIFSADYRGKKHMIRNGILAIGLLAFFVWAIMNVDVLYDSIGYRMEGLFNALTGEGEIDESTIRRGNLIRKGVEIWLDYPLLGCGIDAFKVVSGRGGYSHNNYVELLSGLGLIGFGVYYGYYLGLVWNILKIQYSKSEKWYWVLVIVCLLLFEYGAIAYSVYPVHFILLFACVFLRLQKEQRSIRRESL